MENIHNLAQKSTKVWHRLWNPELSKYSFSGRFLTFETFGKKIMLHVFHMHAHVFAALFARRCNFACLCIVAFMHVLPCLWNRTLSKIWSPRTLLRYIVRRLQKATKQAKVTRRLKHSETVEEHVYHCLFFCFFKCSLFIQLLLLSSRETPIPWRAPPTTCRGFPKLRRHRSCSGRVPHTIWRRRRWRPGVTRDLSPEKLRFHRGKPSHVVRISPCFFRISLSKIGKFEGI